MSNRVKFLLDFANPDKHYDQVAEMDKHLSGSKSLELVENKNVKYTKPMVDLIVRRLTNNPPWHPVTELLNKLNPHLEHHHIDKLMDSGDQRIQAEAAGMSRTNEHFEKSMALGRGDFPYIPNNLAARNAIHSPIVDSSILSKVIRSDEYPRSARTAAVQSLKAHPDDLEWASNFDNHGHGMMAVKAKEMHSMLKDLNLLGESLDSTVRMDRVPEDSMLHSMGAMSASMVGGENFQMHQLGDGHGYLIQFDKNGATEVHHVDKNLQGGMATNQQPAFKFVSAFKKHIQGILDSGKTVRLVAHHAISAPLRKITERMIDKNPGYSQSAVSDAEHEITGDKMHAWTLRKGV